MHESRPAPPATRSGSPRKPARVLLVEDHGAVRRGLELYLTALEYRVVGAARDAEEALELVTSDEVDVMVVDLMLGTSDGVDLIRRVTALPRPPRLLAYSAAGGERLAAALEAGAAGFALKAGPPERFVEALETVLAGGTYVDSDFAQDAPQEALGEAAALTRREREVLFLLSEGLNGRDVAARLVLSPATVRTHIQNAMKKLGARTRSQAIAMLAAHQSRSAGT